MKYLVLVLVAACSFRTHEGASSDAGGDAPPPIDAIDCQFSSQTDTCALDDPGSELTLSGSNSYDTDTGLLNGNPAHHMQLMGQAGPFDAIIVHDLHMTLGASLRATGSLPLGIIAFGTITIDATTLIDVGTGGAGARGSCDNGAVVGQDDGGGAAGGGGGGFGAQGGRGGDGDGDGNGSTGGAGGAAAAMSPPGPLGGCPGAHGGRGDVDGGAGGAGGGAIYLVAKQQITMASSAGIQAGGGGGGPGLVGGGPFDNGDTGGGGGGAGGMIFLEAPVVHALGVLGANGGGGGEASGNGEEGMQGGDAVLGLAAAAGGHGMSSTGTDGGNGGAGTGAAQSVTQVQSGGGGGGGGSVGYVIVRSPDMQLGTASPPAS
jgi:hypothetical protein